MESNISLDNSLPGPSILFVIWCDKHGVTLTCIYYYWTCLMAFCYHLYALQKLIIDIIHIIDQTIICILICHLSMNMLTDIGPKLVSWIVTDQAQVSGMEPTSPCSVNLSPSSVNKITDIIRSLNNSWAGIDNIKAEALKFVKTGTAIPLSDLKAKSFKTGPIPSTTKNSSDHPSTQGKKHRKFGELLTWIGA